MVFRQQLIEAQMDRRLIERTIDVASQSLAFGPCPLRAALDSSPLWGAGRVEDTHNLMGYALRKVMRVVAAQQERTFGASVEWVKKWLKRLRAELALFPLERGLQGHSRARKTPPPKTSP